MRLSIVISTRNRAQSLARVMKSVKGLADEFVVVDNDSMDETQTIAKQFGAKFFRKTNNKMLNVNKNYGFSKATGDWILCLDDDEEIPPKLAIEIKEILRNPQFVNRDSDIVGYWIPRKNIIFGKWITHGIWWPDKQLRLFRNGTGKYPAQHVHEYVTVEGKTETLVTPYIHYNYDTVSQYLQKMQEIYTENEVQKYIALGYRVRWQDAVRFPLSDFLKLYFAQSGYKDGLHGLVLAMLQSFYSFIIFVKLWEREKFREVDIPLQAIVDEMNRSQKETVYWVRSAAINDTPNPLKKIWQRFLRKVRQAS